MTDVDLPDANDAPPAYEASRPEPSTVATAVISATIQPALNVALWQNHVPVLTELTLTTNSEEAAGDVTIDLTCEPPVIGPRSWHLQETTAGQV